MRDSKLISYSCSIATRTLTSGGRHSYHFRAATCNYHMYIPSNAAWAISSEKFLVTHSFTWSTLHCSITNVLVSRSSICMAIRVDFCCVQLFSDKLQLIERRIQSRVRLESQ